MSDAGDYNARQMTVGALTSEHVAELVRDWQRDKGLSVDGKAGPRTIASIEAEIRARSGPPPIVNPRCWPLRALPDGRRPRETSEFKARNPSRLDHNGSDLFYPFDASKDAAIAPPRGDGGRTSNDKWFVPNDWPAIAGAPGRVVITGWISTGFRAWIDIGGGWSIGYFHLSKLLVSAGDAVVMGTPIGIVGDNPAQVDARHLHFELYYGDLAHYPRGVRDPLAFLEGARVFTG